MSETYLNLLTNLPHMEWEATLTLVQDVILGILVVPRLRRRFAVEHARLDSEHGITHTEVVHEHRKGKHRKPRAN